MGLITQNKATYENIFDSFSLFSHLSSLFFYNKKKKKYIYQKMFST